MTSPAVFLREVRDELGKVVWPGRDDIIRLTLTVVFVSLIVGLLLGGLDFLLTKLLEIVVK